MAEEYKETSSSVHLEGQSTKTIEVDTFNLEAFTHNVNLFKDTDNEWKVTGDGLFDTLMSTVDKHLTRLLKNNQVSNPEFAKIYANILVETMKISESMLFKVYKLDKEIELLAEQRNLYASEKLLNDHRTILTDEQSCKTKRERESIGEENKTRLLGDLLNAWVVAYNSSPDAQAIPDSIKVNVVDSITKSLFDSLSVTKADNPLEE